MTYQRKPPHPGYGYDGKRLPYLHDMTVQSIMDELIHDGVVGHPTKLQRYVNAIQIIAQARNITAEAAHAEIEQAVTSQTGRSATAHWKAMASE